MNLLVIALIILIILILLKFVFQIDLITLKQISQNKKLNEITNAFPSNFEVCKKIAGMIGNTDVKIEENKKSKTNIYLVITNKIIVSNTKNSFTRIQDIANKCIISMQDKRILWTNLIFSNLYLIYLILAIILTICGVFRDTMLQIAILTLIGFSYYYIKSYLETDAIIKSRYLAREYMKHEKILKPEEMQEILENYDMISKINVKITNYKLIFSALLKVLIYAVISYICGGI